MQYLVNYILDTFTDMMHCVFEMRAPCWKLGGL